MERDFIFFIPYKFTVLPLLRTYLCVDKNHLLNLNIFLSRSTVDHQKSMLNQPKAANMGSIPTCVLLTGVNLPDHGDLFFLLKKNLVENISPHVATVKSTAATNLKTLVLKTIAQLIRKVRFSFNSLFTSILDHIDRIIEKYYDF